MAEPYSRLFNAVVLQVTASSAPEGVRYQISASRNDRATARYVSAAWSEVELRAAFRTVGVSEVELQELLRGNRRATGGRDARRLLFSAEQMDSMGLTQETPAAVAGPAEVVPAGAERVFSATASAQSSSNPVPDSTPA